MANLVAGGLKSLALYHEKEGATTAKITTAWSEVDGLKIKLLPNARAVVYNDFSMLNDGLNGKVHKVREALSDTKTSFMDLTIWDLCSKKNKVAKKEQKKWSKPYPCTHPKKVQPMKTGAKVKKTGMKLKMAMGAMMKKTKPMKTGKQVKKAV